MQLSELSPHQARKSCKRGGRGVGSGGGKTAGRGNKGHNCRSGGGVRPGFEGGQMPIHRRLPKRGFTNIFKKKIVILNLKDLERFKDEKVIDEIILRKTGMVKGKIDGVKLLGNGEINYPATIKLDLISKSAREKIIKAGGEVQ